MRQGLTASAPGPGSAWGSADIACGIASPSTDRIPVAGPWITEREVQYVTEAAATAWYDRAGEFPRRFEEAFAAYVGRRHAISMPHCTTALHLALAALDVGPGDEVIIPDATWIATAAPVTYVGATPVFADMDPVSWCLTVETIEACLTPRTRAIIAVDLYGSMPDMPALARLASRHGLALIEDAAEAVGAAIDDVPAGAFGAVSVFSFHGSKTLTTGEGGMLVTDSDAIHERVLSLRDHGRPPGDRRFCSTEIGFKARMSPLQAALGLAQLERVEELVDRKRAIFGWYAERLRDRGDVTLNAEPPGTTNGYWMVTPVVDRHLGLTSDNMMDALERDGIDSRPFFRPLSSLPAFAEFPTAHAARERNVEAYDLTPRGINLPSGANLTETVVARVVDRFAHVLDTVESPAVH